MITSADLHALFDAKGKPRIDLRMFSVQRATLTYPDGTEVRVTPEDLCFPMVVRLAAIQ